MKKTAIYIITILMITGVASCKKDLELRPTDAIDASKAYTSVKDLEQGLLGAYSANNQENKIYLGSILADEVALSNENRGQGALTFKWQYTANSEDVSVAYGQYFVLISRVHQVLEAFPNVIPNTTEDAAKMDKIKAELIGLRGIAYYESLINFMPSGYESNALGLAVVLQQCLTCMPGRNTVGEVITQIESDLATAKASDLIPDAPDDVLRLNKAAIAAYQARVALLKKDWTSAITFSSEAITLSGKSLATRNEFVEYWTDLNESETILKYRNGNNTANLWRDVNGDVFFEPSIKLKRLYDQTSDIRYSTYFTSDGDDTSLVNKYVGATNDLKLIRIAEMYLARAEAYAETDQLQSASDDLNSVRSARIEGYTAVTLTTKTEAIAEILNERFKELCFEGDRFYDLKRRSLPVERLAEDVQNPEWQTLPANDYRFAMPIPKYALQANTNTKQNPHY